MKIVSDVMVKAITWVNPSHRVESAVFLLKGHSLSVLPVLDGGSLVGMISTAQLLGAPPSASVLELMQSQIDPAHPTLNIREATELMLRGNLDILPVVNEENELLGLVSIHALLTEMQRPVDPLTEFPWSDSMREWAITKLRNGNEITILFLDVNDFGLFNKKFGHVVGDAVLRNVANVLRDLTNSNLDSVCRYGGDEFCIATLRPADNASELAAKIEQEIARLEPIEAQDTRITVTIGQRGGKRTREREQVHFSATLNNLINLASQDCMLKKVQRNAVVKEIVSIVPLEAVPEVVEAQASLLNVKRTGLLSFEREIEEIEGAVIRIPERYMQKTVRTVPANSLRLTTLKVSVVGEYCHIRVELHVDQPEGSPFQNDSPLADKSQKPVSFTLYSVSVTRLCSEEETLQVVAEATLAALRRALPHNYDLRLEEVLKAQTADNRTLITVIGHFVTPEDTRPIAGSVFVSTDIHRAVATAVLAAANRQLSCLPLTLSEASS